MKQARRRQRQFDQLATPEGVRSILQQLRNAAPNLIPAEEERLISLLNAARYLEKRPANYSNRGRPSLWTPDELSEVITLLRDLLRRETNGRVSLQTFIGQHLPLLSYPLEVTNALERGQINKQEATSLFRLTAERLQTTETEAQKLREDLLKAHIATAGSQNQLRERVNELLGKDTLFSRETLVLGMAKTDSLLEFNRQDVKHIFFETMRDLFYAIRSLNPEDLLDEDIAEFMTTSDALTNKLKAIEQRVSQMKTLQKANTAPLNKPAPKGELQIISDPLTTQITYKFK